MRGGRTSETELARKQPRAIQSGDEYDRYADELEEITSREDASAEEKAYADLLTSILAAYDEAHPPFAGRATPAQVLAHVLENRGLKQADLIPVVGNSAYVSQIVGGKRGISRAMAKKLGEFFGLNASVFLVGFD